MVEADPTKADPGYTDFHVTSVFTATVENTTESRRNNYETRLDPIALYDIDSLVCKTTWYIDEGNMLASPTGAKPERVYRYGSDKAHACQLPIGPRLEVSVFNPLEPDETRELESDESGALKIVDVKESRADKLKEAIEQPTSLAVLVSWGMGPDDAERSSFDGDVGCKAKLPSWELNGEPIPRWLFSTTGYAGICKAD